MLLHFRSSLREAVLHFSVLKIKEIIHLMDFNQAWPHHILICTSWFIFLVRFHFFLHLIFYTYCHQKTCKFDVLNWNTYLFTDFFWRYLYYTCNLTYEVQTVALWELVYFNTFYNIHSNDYDSITTPLINIWQFYIEFFPFNKN